MCQMKIHQQKELPYKTSLNLYTFKRTPSCEMHKLFAQVSYFVHTFHKLISHMLYSIGQSRLFQIVFIDSTMLAELFISLKLLRNYTFRRENSIGHVEQHWTITSISNRFYRLDNVS